MCGNSPVLAQQAETIQLALSGDKLLLIVGQHALEPEPKLKVAFDGGEGRLFLLSRQAP